MNIALSLQAIAATMATAFCSSHLTGIPFLQFQNQIHGIATFLQFITNPETLQLGKEGSPVTPKDLGVAVLGITRLLFLIAKNTTNQPLQDHAPIDLLATEDNAAAEDTIEKVVQQFQHAQASVNGSASDLTSANNLVQSYAEITRHSKDERLHPSSDNMKVDPTEVETVKREIAIVLAIKLAELYSNNQKEFSAQERSDTELSICGQISTADKIFFRNSTKGKIDGIGNGNQTHNLVKLAKDRDELVS